jgi:hypothetical protein
VRSLEKGLLAKAPPFVRPLIAGVAVKTHGGDISQ